MKNFIIAGKPFQLGFGEVLKVIYKDSNPNYTHEIVVKELTNIMGGDETAITATSARPINPYLRVTPLQGEMVLLIKAPSAEVSGLGNSTELYYLDVVNIQSLLGHNSLPTSGKVDSSGGGNYGGSAAGGGGGGGGAKVDKNFPENTKAGYIQPYVGDVIVEGRYGQTLRFSSTPKSKSLFSKPPVWTDGSPGDPITVLRNSKHVGSSGKFYTEDIEKDDSLIILTSNQKLPVKPASTAKKAAQEVGVQDKYEKNMIYLTSGRLILNARTEDILGYAKKGIHLAAQKVAIDAQSKFTVDSPAIHLGAQATEPLIFGQKWATWMNNFITALGTQFVATANGPSGPLQGNPNWANIASLQGQIQTLLSQISKTK